MPSVQTVGFSIAASTSQACDMATAIGTVQAAVKRPNHTAALQLASGNTGFTASAGSITSNGGAYFFYFMLQSTFTTIANGYIFQDASAVRLTLTTGLTLQCERLTAAGTWTATGPASPAVSLNTWHRVDMYVDLSSTTASRIKWRLDNVEVTDSINLTLLAASGGNSVSLQNPGNAGAVYFSDFIGTASTISYTSSYIYDHAVATMFASSDSQVGTWTGGAGGVTNLFDAVNNFPPIGSGSPTNLTQIHSIDGAGNTAAAEYRANCGTYTAAAAVIAPTLVLNSVVDLGIWANHGEDVATGTKTGAVGAQANPASASLTTFNYGNDAGAAGTWPTLWAWSSRAESSVSVTLGSNLILNARKTDAGTRAASIDALFAYVSMFFTSPPPVAKQYSYRQAVQRAAVR